MLTSNPELTFGFTYLNIHHLSILPSPVPTSGSTLDVHMLPVPSNPVNTRRRTIRILQKKHRGRPGKTPGAAKCCRAEEECCAFIRSGGPLGFLLSAVLAIGCASHCRSPRPLPPSPPSVAFSLTIFTISMGLGQTYLGPTQFKLESTPHQHCRSPPVRGPAPSLLQHTYLRCIVPPIADYSLPPQTP